MIVLGECSVTHAVIMFVPIARNCSGDGPTFTHGDDGVDSNERQQCRRQSYSKYEIDALRSVTSDFRSIKKFGYAEPGIGDFEKPIVSIQGLHDD